MAKKQSRRSVSLRGSTYTALKAWCDEQGMSVSHCCEVLIANHLGRPEPSQHVAHRHPRPRPTEDGHGGYTEF